MVLVLLMRLRGRHLRALQDLPARLDSQRLGCPCTVA